MINLQPKRSTQRCYKSKRQRRGQKYFLKQSRKPVGRGRSKPHKGSKSMLKHKGRSSGKYLKTLNYKSFNLPRARTSQSKTRKRRKGLGSRKKLRSRGVRKID